MGPEYPSALQSFVASDPNSPLVLQAQWRLETLQQVAKEQEEQGAGQSGKMSRIPAIRPFFRHSSKATGRSQGPRGSAKMVYSGGRKG